MTRIASSVIVTDIGAVLFDLAKRRFQHGVTTKSDLVLHSREPSRTFQPMPQRWRVFVGWFADLITPLGSCQCRFFRPYGMVRKIDIRGNSLLFSAGECATAL